MRCSVVFSILLAVLVSTISGSAQGQVNLFGLISSATAQRYGMTRAWHTNVEVDRARGRIVYMSLYVSSTDVHTVYEVVAGDITEEFSELTLNAFGEAIGKEEAQKRANERLEELRAAGNEVEMATLVVPQITLYFTTDHGIVHAIDAETGRTRWAAVVGNANYPTLKPSANDEYVAVVNGSSLYVIDAKSGKQMWSRRLDGVPGAGPAVSEDLVHAPMLTGMMETYKLADRRQPPRFFKAIGRSLIQPIVSSRSVAWPTDRGHLYVTGANNGDARYRLVAQDTIVAPAAHLDKYLFVASFDGYAYCVHEMNGDVIWRFSTGHSISHQPIAIGEACYLISDDDGLFSVNIETGQEQWRTPGVRKFLAASNERVYCLDRIGRMLMIDVKTGVRIAVLNTQGFDLSMVNTQTDRVYIGMTSGVVQSLRESQLTRALIHKGIGGIEDQNPQADQTGDDTTTGGGMPATDGGGDPFGTRPATDPFGSGAGSDPFGSGTGGDPFGSGSKGDDPFSSDTKSPFD